MSFLNKLIGKKEDSIKTYEEFWIWFQKNKEKFVDVVQKDNDIENNFLNILSSKLNNVKDGFYFLTGLLDNNSVELIITADGVIKNIVFVEELISVAPKIKGRVFTALKPSINNEDFGINMGKYNFNNENLFFSYNIHRDSPDLIDINIHYSNYYTEDIEQIEQGIFIFLDNYLGELYFATVIDNIKVEGQNFSADEKIPINKLKDYLIWRQKEFIEKHEGVKYNSENDKFSVIEAELENGNNLVAVINSDLLRWNCKPSYPGIAVLIINFDGNYSNGMPSNIDNDYLVQIENEILGLLTEQDGNLNIGRQTANGERLIYFACSDFRKPSKVLFDIKKRYSYKFEIEFDIYKDKYWQSFEHFI